MKLVHAADLHLGYRAYHRTNPHGINIRESDVARAFRETLDRVAEIQPQLFLIAGDIFHTVRPSNAAIADAFRQFSRFCSGAPETQVVIVAGNHDSPKAAEIGSILRLFDEIDGVHVVHHEGKRLHFPELDAAVLSLPHSELISETRLAIEPDDSVDHNILLAHAEVDDQRLKLLMDFGAAKLSSDAIDADQWSYVGLGHYHVRSRLARNMYYAGAIERTSLNIWAEADNARDEKEDTWREAAWGKGFIELDLESGKPEFHVLESPRPVIDLDPIFEGEREPEELNEAIETSLAGVPGGIEGKIVRLRIFNIPRDVYRELDHRKIRDYRTQALHFHLDARPPDVKRLRGSGAPVKPMTLEEELREYFTRHFKPEALALDRDALIELGLRFLLQAEEAESLEGRE
jgi:DNA repair exonuclease SbcCD nuclease subunit